MFGTVLDGCNLVQVQLQMKSRLTKNENAFFIVNIIFLSHVTLSYYI